MTILSQSVIIRLQHRYRETGRVTERHRSERPLATSHADDSFIVNSALWNQIMNCTQLHAHLREMRGTRVSRQTIRNRLHQHGLRVVLDDLQGYLTTPPGTGVIVREHLCWTRNQWAVL
uniref:Transposase Tc1-like domain-containing protein n=1 Tax=Sinocyclocheilus grahami TaxID=75366 RepID=A0A672MYD0_SINGR